MTVKIHSVCVWTVLPHICSRQKTKKGVSSFLLYIYITLYLFLFITYDQYVLTFSKKEREKNLLSQKVLSFPIQELQCIINFYAENIVHSNQQLVATFLSCAVMRFLC